MIKSYYIIKSEHKGLVWELPEELMQKFNLKTGDQVKLWCGPSMTEVFVYPPKNSSNTIKLSSEAISALHIPENTSMRIKKLGDNSFRLGPVIGILTFPGHIPRRLKYYSCYARRNVNNGLLYVFRGRDINLPAQTIKGYYYDHIEKKWKPEDLPFPDAVMDRCYPNPYISHVLLETLIGPGRIFNKKTMIDKLDLYRAFNSDKFISNYIPEGRLFSSHNDLDYFLEKYPEVFLKPTNGMKGIGIVVVKPLSDGQLKCTYAIKGKTVNEIIPSSKNISYILVKAAGRQRPYIIQQAIPRMEYKGGPFSLRTWAMKNGKGQWVIPGMFAKGSLGQGFLTNFTAGAKLIPLNELYSNILPRMPFDKQQFLDFVTHLTLKSAKALDKIFGPLGELGMDIVFDTSGKPWLIEVNGNPGNIPIFQQKDYPLWRHLVFQYPLDYATYLAGFYDLD